MSSDEKRPSSSSESSGEPIKGTDLEYSGKTLGYVTDITQYDDASNLKTTRDGKIVLIPQPNESQDDPLNWSQTKKNVVLFVISFTALLPNFGSAEGIPALLPQQMQWHMDPNTLQHNLSGNLFMIGAGGLVVVGLSSYFGRLPVIFYFQACALGMGIWCAAAKSYNSYLGARILLGFFASVAEGGGLMWIKDIFFFHEHPRKINFWTAGFLIAPYVGPLAASFIEWKSTWRWSFWLLTMLNGISLALIIFFLDETLYNRRATYPPRMSKIFRLTGIEQIKNRKVNGVTALMAIRRPFEAFIKAPVWLMTVYYFLSFAWIIGVNATVGVWLQELYGFGPKNLGVFFLAGIIGVTLGSFVGHWLHDYVARVYTRTHNHRLHAESRLTVCYPATVLMFVALLLLGFALQRHWHYMTIAVFYAVHTGGFMFAAVGINAYLLDAYPEAPGEISAWIGFGRMMGGFMSTYVQIEWVQKGPEKAFGAQAGIVVAALVFPISLQLFGARLRAWQGPMSFE